MRSKGFYISGWYQGKYTYLWFGNDREVFGTLAGGKLKRLCKSILRHLEKE